MAKKSNQKTTQLTRSSERRAASRRRDGEVSEENQKIAETVRLGLKVDPVEAVAEINRLWRSGLESVAEYLLVTYFAGDIESLDEGMQSNAGLARLKDYEDQLDVSHLYLRLILRALNQKRRLEQNGLSTEARALSLTHHMRVLSIDDDKKKTRLLENAAKNEWGIAALDAAAKKLRPERKPVAFTPKRALGWLARAEKLMLPAVEDGLAEALGQLEVKERTAAKKRLDAQIKTLQKMRAACEK